MVQLVMVQPVMVQLVMYAACHAWTLVQRRLLG